MEIVAIIVFLFIFIFVTQQLGAKRLDNIDSKLLLRENAPYEDFVDGNELLKGSNVIVKGPLRVYPQLFGMNNFHEFYVGVQETKKMTITSDRNHATIYVGPYKFLGELHLGMTGFELHDFEIKKKKGSIDIFREYKEIFNILNRLDDPNFVHTLRQLLLHWALFERIRTEGLEFSNKQSGYFIEGGMTKSSMEKKRAKLLEKHTEHFFTYEGYIEDYATQRVDKKYKYDLRFDREELLVKELGIMIKGPIYMYTKKFNFTGFGAGTLIIKETIDVNIKFEKEADRTIRVKSMIANNQIIPIQQSNGQYSLPHTIYKLLEELDKFSLDLHTLKEALFEILFSLDLFNGAINRGLIREVDDYSFVVNDVYLIELQMNELHEELFQKVQRIFIELDRLKGYTEQGQFGSSHDKEAEIDQYLKILELDTNVRNFTIIKRQYKKLAKKYHPDLANGDPEKMSEINVAYEALDAIFNQYVHS
ncbi:DnaJ-domain-containing protein 1 [Cytobacillus eiseniae]|uniref:DnaJ-domain-containing protein 1 n=1 Tax=Cytobacillus eiseniae TaxID=762947 RepID=A0ABS4RK63_9BACI|nr:DnaJ domain-containing protein [Cytobacillus eiseniae]MBP2243283.1 DnaJ-domain-containing protein 1 [Cytobacillus eiseniae]